MGLTLIISNFNLMTWIVIEEITDMGRMAAVMPVLQFICKELHVNSAEFRSILRDTALDRCHLE